jgi:hypothetical protein
MTIGRGDFMQMQQTTSAPQQLRGFVAIWVGLTLLIGIATFVAIYVGTGSLDGENTANALSGSAFDNSNVNNPISNGESDPVVAVAPNGDNNPANNAADAPEGSEASAVISDDGQGGDGPENAAASESAAVVAQETEEPAEASAQETPAPTPEPTTPAIQETDFNLGVQLTTNPDPNVMAGYLDAAANQLNLEWVKLQIRWEFVEPEQGVYDWTRLDGFFSQTADYDLKVLASIVTAPDWAREPGANLEMHGPPADNQVFADFVAQVLTRYPGKIHAVEIWNEMNIDREWASVNGINAANYVEMARVVANTIRFLDPNIIVVSGAPSPTGVNAVFARDDISYTEELIAAGILNVVDCYGAHHNGYNIGPNVPFNQVPADPTATFRGPFDNPHPSWSFYSTLNAYANRIQAAGSDVPLCVTEFGWPTTEDMDGFPPGFEFANDNTLQEHGQFIVEAIQLMEEWGFVRLAFLWNLNFGPEEGFNPTRDNVPYSLIRPGYIPSPAWLPISQMDFRGRE